MKQEGNKHHVHGTNLPVFKKIVFALLALKHGKKLMVVFTTNLQNSHLITTLNLRTLKEMST